MECAWCMVEQGIELGEGSHGICDRHAKEVMQQYQERRAARTKLDDEQEQLVAA